MEPKCLDAEPYECADPITCAFHAREVQVLLAKLAAEAEDIIDDETGKGDSNGSEAKFNVLPRFREKGAKLQLLHYCCSTNLGLLQGNVLAATSLGLDHWLFRVLERAQLSISVAQRVQVQQTLVQLIRAHQKRQDPASVRARCSWKRQRAADGERRKQFRQPGPESLVTHAYHSELHAMELNSVEDDSGADFVAVATDGSITESEIGAASAAASEIGAVSAAASEIGAASATASEIGAVSAAASEIGAVSAAASEIGATSAAASEIGAVSAAASEIGAVSAAASEIGAISAAASEIGATSAAASEIGAVSAAASEIGAISAAASEIGAVSAAAPIWKVGKPLDDFFDVWEKTGLILLGDLEATGKNVYLDSVLELFFTARLWKDDLLTSVSSEDDSFHVDVRPYAHDIATCEEAAHSRAGGLGIAEERLTPFICNLTSFSQARAAKGLPFANAWAKFLAWIEKVKTTEVDYVALVFYNGNRYDLPLLIEYGRAHGIDVCATLLAVGVMAIGDALVWCKDYVVWPTAPVGFKQVQVFEALGFGEYEAHTAASDVQALVQILAHALLQSTMLECHAKLFVTLKQHEARQATLRANWLAKQGGYGRIERPLCQCGAVMASSVTNATTHCGQRRRFYCSRVPYRWELDNHPQRAGEGCATTRWARGPAFKPGFEPRAKAAARAPIDNGVVGACTCAGGCLTGRCPCRAAKKRCVPGKCHSTSRSCSKCCNTVEGERRHKAALVARKEAQIAKRREAARGAV
eukprot:SAG31_NODE_1624_length_7717_cov_43.227750_3_plen_758_part_00